MQRIAGTSGEVKAQPPRLAGRSGASADAPAAGLDLWSAPPARHARMLKPGELRHGGKYHDLDRAPSPDDLRQHLGGAVTLAAPLVGADGLALAGLLDIDHGGRAAVMLALEVATSAGFSAYAEIYPSSDGHDGGYLRLAPFAESVAPSRIHQALEPIRAQVCSALGLELAAIDIGPAGGQCFRLPLAYHLRAGSWGLQVMADGRIFDRNDPPQRRAAQRAAAQLPPNDPALLPAVQELPAASAGGMASAGHIAAWCAANDLVTLLERDGCKVVGRKGQDTYLDCPCGGHKRGAHNRALRVTPSRNPDKHGPMVLYGYGTGCKYYTELGKPLDAMAVYCRNYGTQPRAVLDLPKMGLSPIRATAARDNCPALETEPITHILKRQSADDATLGDRARRVFAALLDLMGEGRTWCRPSNARLVKVTGLCKRTVQRAMRDLEQAGYIATAKPDGEQWNGRTLIRQIAPALAGASVTTSTMGDSKIQLSPILEHVRGGDSEPAACPSDLPDPDWLSLCALAEAPKESDSYGDAVFDAPAAVTTALEVTPPSHAPLVTPQAEAPRPEAPAARQSAGRAAPVAYRAELARTADPLKRDRALEKARMGLRGAAYDDARQILDPGLRAQAIAELDQLLTPSTPAPVDLAHTALAAARAGRLAEARAMLPLLRGAPRAAVIAELARAQRARAA